MSHPWIDRLTEQFSHSTDLKNKRIESGTLAIELLYLEPLCDQKKIHEQIVQSFLFSLALSSFITTLTAYGAKPHILEGEMKAELIGGSVLVFVESTVFSLSVCQQINAQPGDVESEHNLLGPKSSLSEDIDVSLRMLRQRYPRQELKVETYAIGHLTKTKVALLFDTQLAKPELIERIRKRLGSVDIDVLQSANQLELMMNRSRWTLFPVAMTTERPDRVVLNLSQGKAVILVQGTTFVSCMPAVFYDFMVSMDEIYGSFWSSRPVLVMRYVALFLTILLPALYVSMISYNPELTRAQLTLSIAGSRAAVPYPSYVEVIIMLFLIEALTEASLRLPKYIGSTATTVGGLILGQAAQQAGLVSSIMIIITSVVAISNFVIPINTMTFAMRIVKYPIVVLATFFGVVGTVFGLFMIIATLARTRSFGEPFLRVFPGEDRTAKSKRRGAGHPS